jgi:hypothetical protein
VFCRAGKRPSVAVPEPAGVGAVEAVASPPRELDAAVEVEAVASPPQEPDAAAEAVA